MTTQELTDAWRRFRRGDLVSTPELRVMLKSIDDSLPLLETLPEGGAVLFRVRLDRTAIRGYLESRSRRTG